MRHIRHVGIFVAALSGLSLNAIAQSRQPGPPPEDKVYSAKEVDKKAVITNQKELDPEKSGAATDCRSGSVVLVKAVLRRSGEVTDIKVFKPASCSLDKKAAKIVSHAKFTPAVKDGVPVSQSVVIEYQFRKY